MPSATTAGGNEAGFYRLEIRSGLYAGVTQDVGEGRLVLGSGPGAALLGRRLAPPGRLQTVLTRTLAARLGAAVGDRVVLGALRTAGGREEDLALPLTVTGIMEPALWDGDGALLADETLSAVEQWRDGMAVPAFGWPGVESAVPFAYRNFRLYARDLPALRSLHLDLTARGLSVSAPRLKEFENIMGLNSALGLIFGIIATAGGIGFLLSFGATLWGNVERKRQALCVLRLHGLLRRDAALFPVAQAVVVVTVGWGLAWLLLTGAAEALNRSLAGAIRVDGAISRLDPQQLGIAFAATLAVGLLASSAAAWRVTRIEPGEGIHGL